MKAPPRDSYLRVALLTGLVLLGWLWDFAIGGGRAHAVGWLVALAVVAGVMTLVVRSARSTRLADPASVLAMPAPQGPSVPNAAVPPVRVSTDRARLSDVQQSSSALFTVAGLPSPPVTEPPSDAVLFSAGDPAVGFLALTVVDADAHVEGIWVVPGSMRRGIGSALLRAAEDYAVEHGRGRVTALSSGDVPWQAGFFARHGYRPIVPGPQLAEKMSTYRYDQSGATALAKSPAGDVSAPEAAGTMAE